MKKPKAKIIIDNNRRISGIENRNNNENKMKKKMKKKIIMKIMSKWK